MGDITESIMTQEGYPFADLRKQITEQQQRIAQLETALADALFEMQNY